MAKKKGPHPPPSDPLLAFRVSSVTHAALKAIKKELPDWHVVVLACRMAPPRGLELQTTTTAPKALAASMLRYAGEVVGEGEFHVLGDTGRPN